MSGSTSARNRANPRCGFNACRFVASGELLPFIDVHEASREGVAVRGRTTELLSASTLQSLIAAYWCCWDWFGVDGAFWFVLARVVDFPVAEHIL